MTRYIIRRLLQAIPLLFLISLVLFVMMQNMGDPLATMGGRKVTRPEDRIRLARQLGLDKPILVQYIYWLIGNDWTKTDLDGDGVAETPGVRKGVLRGDWGTSLVNRKPVTEVIGERLPNTLLLMLAAEAVIILLALLIGIYSALRQYSTFDNIITAVTFFFYSMPVFFFALGAMYIFSVNFKKWGLPYLPTVGMFEPGAGQTTSQVAWHMILPVATLSFTIIALDLPFLLGGAVVTERIFGWPGMGRLFLDHVARSDTAVVMGILMMIAVAVIVFQILADVTYAWLDPRIRYK
jgi:peptide/nickel transport system permease protein